MPPNIGQNISQIFPISDAPSARLMKLKAWYLFRAGILTAPQRTAIACEANKVLAARMARPAGDFKAA
jgi:hypothetical protein